MKRSLSTIILVITLLVVPSAGAAPVAVPAAPMVGDQIMINEIYRGGTLSGTGNEWIEVVLTQCLTAAQLEGFYVGDSTSSTAAKYSGYRFTSMSSIASTFAAGTVIVVGGTGGVTQDVSYNPGSGDWNILLQTSGAYLTGNGYNGDLAGTDVAYVDTNGTYGDATLSGLGFAVRWGSTVGAFGAVANVAITAPANPGVMALISDQSGATTPTNWVVQTTTQGNPNGGTNTTWISGLRSGGCGDSAPLVSSTTPTNNAINVATNATVSVTFSEDVTLSGTIGIVCTSGTQNVTPTGGPLTWTLPHSDFTAEDSCSITIPAAQVSDTDLVDPPDNMAADYLFSFTIVAADPCSQPYTHTYQIQGAGAAAAITGTVTTQGVVIGDYELPTGTGQIKGFYLQDLTGDGDAATSDGIFIYDGGVDNVSIGQVVRVTGNASDYQDQTQVSSSTIVQCGTTGNVTPVDVTLPFPSSDYLERFEGMLVRLPQTLYVTEHFQLGRFGQVVVTSDADRLQQPTNVALPGAPALALQATNNLDRIIVDDDTNVENPDPIKFGRSGNPLSASNTLRGGDSVTGIVGTLVYGWAGNSASGNAYRVRPLAALNGAVNFQPTNARPATPGAISGRLRVAAGNLLNYFNTFGAGACTNGVGGTATDCRGADDATEFGRQWPKTVANLVGGGADIIDLMELENDGYGAASAIQDLVNKLNDATAPDTYAFIDADARTSQVNALGVDAIKVGLIYKPAKVTPVGVTAALNTTAFVNGGDSAARNRPALAQAFEEVSTGARFVVCVNHFKSKGSACDAPDAGDGQGNCNVVRTNAANALTAWLAGDPTGIGDADVLITGDLNSYAKEDPITAIIGAGYTDLIAAHIGQSAYSYAFDGQWGYLDHALATSALAAQVADLVEWHVNADEPSALDYNTNFKSAGQLVSLYAADEFRSSDHDPIIIGLDLCATAAAPTDLSVAQSEVNDVALTWSAAANAASYRVWRDTAPYFTPAGAPITTTVATSYVDGGRIGDPTTNYYYVIAAVNACGDASGVSNRVGEFDFALTPGQ